MPAGFFVGVGPAGVRRVGSVVSVAGKVVRVERMGLRGLVAVWLLVRIICTSVIGVETIWMTLALHEMRRWHLRCVP